MREVATATREAEQVGGAGGVTTGQAIGVGIVAGLTDTLTEAETRAAAAGDRVGSRFGGAVGGGLAGLGGIGIAAGGALAAGLGVALAAGAAVAVAGTAAVLKTGFAELSEASAVTAQIEAGLASTGRVAGISADGINALASSLQNLSGFEDDAIAKGAALLLTFTQVRDEVGKGNDVFTRATQAGVDLAARGLGSIESNALQLGKALQDPVAGLAGLARAGVRFTEGQREQIKALVESQQVLAAQKIILAEVEEQVGGSGRALGQSLTGQVALTKRAFEDLSEGVAKVAEPALLPFLDAARSLIERSAAPAADLAARVVEVGSNLKDLLQPAIEQFGAAVSGIIGPAVERFREALGDNTKELGSAVGGFLTFAQVIGGVVAVALQLAIDGAALLVRGYGLIVPVVLKVNSAILTFVGVSLGALGDFVAGALLLFERTIGGAAGLADAFGLDGVADGLRSASDGLQTFRQDVQAQTDAIEGALRDAGGRMGEGFGVGVANALRRTRPLVAAEVQALIASLNVQIKSQVLTGSEAAGSFIATVQARGIKPAKEAGEKVAQSFARPFLGSAKQAGDDAGKALRDALTKQLDGARDALSRTRELLEPIRSFREGIEQEVQQFASLDVIDLAIPTPEAIRTALTGRLAVIRQFAKQIQALATKGIDKDLIAQVAQQGPLEGRAVAAALAAANATQVKAINAAQAGIRSASAGTGRIAGQAVNGNREAELFALQQRQERSLASIDRKLDRLGTLAGDTSKGVADALKGRTKQVAMDSVRGSR